MSRAMPSQTVHTRQAECHGGLQLVLQSLDWLSLCSAWTSGSGKGCLLIMRHGKQGSWCDRLWAWSQGVDPCQDLAPRTRTSSLPSHP